MISGLLCLGSVALAESGFLVPESQRQPVGKLVPNYVLEVPDSIDDILVADAANARLWRFSVRDGTTVSRDDRYMSIGVNGVGKRRAWDRRTPLGVYFITERLDTSRMHEKYGVAAYPLDYPNAWDRYQKKTGDGIWLHGVDRRNPERPPLDTDGCLALRNEELLKLSNRLLPQVTPVIVTRELQMVRPEVLDETRVAFRTALEMWREAQQTGDVLAYLSLYSKNFRYGEMDKNAWSDFRLGVFEAREMRDLQLDDVLLLADPEEEDLYLSRFTQVVTTADGEVNTTKRLYWKRNGDAWRIISEDTG